MVQLFRPTDCLIYHQLSPIPLEIHSPGIKIRRNNEPKSQEEKKTTLIFRKCHRPPTWKRIAKCGIAFSTTLSCTVSYSNFNFIHKI